MENEIIPSSEAIEWIKKNPERASDFDAEYGSGSADKILNKTTEQPTEPAEQPVNTVSVEQPVNTVPVETNTSEEKDGFIKDTGKAIVEGFINIGSETAQFIDEVDNAASSWMDDNLGFSTVYQDGEGFPLSLGTQKEAVNSAEKQGIEPTRISDLITEDTTIFGKERDTVIGRFTQPTVQFLGAMLGAGKLLKIKPMTTKGGFITGAVADTVAFDPDDANLIRILDEEFGISSDMVTAALANDEDNPFVNRAKNAGTGGVIGGVATTTLRAGTLVFRQLKLRIKARKEIEETGTISQETATEADGYKELFTKLHEDQKIIKQQAEDGKFILDGDAFINKNGDILDSKTGIKLGAEDFPEGVNTPVKVVEPKVKPVEEIKPFGGKQFKPKAIVNLIKDIKKNPALLDNVDELVNSRFILNPEYYNGSKSSEAIITATAKALKDQGIYKAAGIDTVKTFEMHTENLAERMAQDLDVTADTFKANLRNVAASAEEQGMWLTAGRVEMTRINKAIDEVIVQIDNAKVSGTSTEDLYKKYLDLAADHADIQLSVQGIKTATGRNLNINKFEVDSSMSDVALDRLEEIGGAIKGGTKVDDLIKQLRRAKTPAARNAVMRSQASWGNKMWSVAGETFINNILINPTTHALNVGAGSANLLLRPVVRGMGSRSKDDVWNSVKEEYYVFSTLFESLNLFDTIDWKSSTLGSVKLNDASPLATTARSFIKSRSVLDTTDKIKGANNGGRAMSSDNFNMKNKPLSMLVDLAGIASTGTSRLLSTEDQLLKHIAYRANVKARASADAASMNVKQLNEAGYDGSLFTARRAYIKDMANNAVNTHQILNEKYIDMVRKGQMVNDPELRNAFIKQNLGSYNKSSKYANDALEEARAVTFTTPLEKDDFMYGLNSWAKAQPALKQVVPFIQTPSNVLRENFDRVPVINNFMRGLAKDLESTDPRTQALARGKFSYGWAMSMAAISLASQGRLTGSGPSFSKDPKLAKIWNDDPNWQANSYVHIDSETGEKTFYDLSKLLPHFGALTLVGQFNGYLERGGLTDDDVSLWMGGIVSMFASQVTMQSGLSNVGQFMNIISGDAKPWEVEKFLQDRVASQMPYANGAYFLNKELDGVMRDLTDFDEKIKSRMFSPILNLAGVTRDAPIQYDWLSGKPKNIPEYTAGFIKTKKVTNLDREQAKVYSELRKLDLPVTSPSRVYKGREMSPEVFQLLNKKMGTVKYKDKTLLQTLSREIDSKFYDKDAIKQPYGISDFRRNYLNEWINGFKELAIAEIMKENPSIINDINKAAEIESTLDSGDPVSNDAVDFLKGQFKLD